MDSDKTILGKLDTIKHIHRVRELLHLMILRLDERAKNHDWSKLESPQAEIFGEYGGDLAKTVYGSEEYQKLLEKVKPAIEDHYSKERHHPQHHKDGVNDMTLLDMIEMLADWKASSERMNSGNIRKSIEHNKTRFGISDQLARIFENTVKEEFQE